MKSVYWPLFSCLYDCAKPSLPSSVPAGSSLFQCAVHQTARVHLKTLLLVVWVTTVAILTILDDSIATLGSCRDCGGKDHARVILHGHRATCILRPILINVQESCKNFIGSTHACVFDTQDLKRSSDFVSASCYLFKLPSWPVCSFQCTSHRSWHFF